MHEDETNTTNNLLRNQPIKMLQGHVLLKTYGSCWYTCYTNRIKLNLTKQKSDTLLLGLERHVNAIGYVSTWTITVNSV